MSDPLARLQQFLISTGQDPAVTVLTADASTREYFRISWDGNSAISCVYPEPFEEALANYLDVTSLFLAGDLPVARVFTSSRQYGVVVQEDLGDQILRTVLAAADEATWSELVDEAIGTIASIQAATAKAFEVGSIASQLRFDTAKLVWELNYFKTHFFETFLKRPLTAQDDQRLSREFLELSTELESYARVLCHRDFHAANLMIDTHGRMRIIDHQDARIGSPAYDLVSLLLDRVTELPTYEWLADKQGLLLEKRVALGMEHIDKTAFETEFRLQAIQRCLKAAGTFSYQSIMRGKTHFIPFIGPMLSSSVQAADALGRFPAIREILGREIEVKP
jgi:aminoglycoside/choline kinase family phosphotransferase